MLKMWWKNFGQVTEVREANMSCNLWNPSVTKIKMLMGNSILLLLYF